MRLPRKTKYRKHNFIIVGKGQRGLACVCFQRINHNFITGSTQGTVRKDFPRMNSLWFLKQSDARFSTWPLFLTITFTSLYEKLTKSCKRLSSFPARRKCLNLDNALFVGKPTVILTLPRVGVAKLHAHFAHFFHIGLYIKIQYILTYDICRFHLYSSTLWRNF